MAINISGIDKARLLQALWWNAGRTKPEPESTNKPESLSYQEAQDAIERAKRFTFRSDLSIFDDYRGRAINVTLTDNYLHREDIYDRYAGDGTCARIIKELRAKTKEERHDWCVPVPGVVGCGESVPVSKLNQYRQCEDCARRYPYVIINISTTGFTNKEAVEILNAARDLRINHRNAWRTAELNDNARKEAMLAFRAGIANLIGLACDHDAKQDRIIARESLS